MIIQRKLLGTTLLTSVLFPTLYTVILGCTEATGASFKKFDFLQFSSCLRIISFGRVRVK